MRLESFRWTSLVIALAALAAAPARADMPDGTFVVDMTGTDGIFDVGSFMSCDTAYGVTACLTVDMQADGFGNYTGTAGLDFSGDLVGTLSGVGNGKLVAGGRMLRACFDTAGTLDGSGAAVKGCVNGRIDPISGAYTGSGRVTVSIQGAGSQSVRGIFMTQFTREDWTLSLDVHPVDPKRLAGTATAVIGANVYLLDLSGVYNARRDVSNLRSRPANALSNGALVLLNNLVVAGPDVVGGRLTYRVQGVAGRELLQ